MRPRVFLRIQLRLRGFTNQRIHVSRAKTYEVLFNTDVGVSVMTYARWIGIAIVFCLVLIPGNPLTGWAYEDTQCFKCHTSAKQLIEITREIAKARPALKSAEIEGEG